MFKVGDRVKCIRGCSPHIAEGQEYTISAVLDGSSLVSIKSVGTWWEYYRFELVKPEAPKLDLTKPVQTRQGKPVRILSTEVKGTYPVVGLLQSKDGLSESAQQWTLDGEWYGGGTLVNLVNVPPKPVTKYVVVFKGKRGTACCSSYLFSSEDEARNSYPDRLITVLPVEIMED